MERLKPLTPEAVLHVGAMVPITVIIGGNIATAQEHRIYYIKPDGTTGYWPATVKDAVNGHITYSTAQIDIDQSASWIFWGWEKNAAGDENVGKATRVNVYDVGAVPI